jgi:hypothetical protein
MRRIISTAPVLQAFLIVLGAAAVFIFAQVLSLLLGYQQLFNNLPTLQDEAKAQYYFFDVVATPLRNLLHQDFPNPSLLGSNPTPDVITVLFFLLQSLITWFLFSAAVYGLTRLLYKKEAVRNFKGILALVGYARITWIPFLVVVVMALNNDLADISQILVLVISIWQLVLIIVGIKQGLNLSWNKAMTVVLLPVVIILFVPLPGFGSSGLITIP